MDILWRIELFGTLTARQGDQVISRFRTRQTASVLAYLAYYRERAHPRDALIELVWSDAEPEAGRHNLRTALSALRRQLETDGVSPGSVIRADRFTVQLNPERVTTDVAEFDMALAQVAKSDPATQIALLQRCLDISGNAFLPGCYEDWIVPQQLRLEDAYVTAARQLIALLEQSGTLDAALHTAVQAVTTHPQCEELHLELIRLYAAKGQTGAALRQYHKLEAALGEPPSPTAQEIIAAVRRGALVGTRTVAPTKPLVLPVSPQPHANDSQSLSLPTIPQERSAATVLPLTRFFGREDEIARLTELLAASWNTKSGTSTLTTLTGIGGSGKTRLALEMMHRITSADQLCAWFVPLANITDAQLIGQAICGAMGLPASSASSPLERACQVLEQKPSLLILDNFEQFAERDGAEVIKQLLDQVSTLTLVVTSQRRLNLTREREFPVAPLPTPGRRNAGAREGWRLEALLEVPSVQLFTDRAQSAHPAFQITRTNANAIAELCERLEGIPLAIELAAARAAVMTPAQMLGQIADRFTFLVGNAHDVPARFRTLHATLDWSYALLQPELQRFFARLSVFRGGWTAEDAADICLRGEAFPEEESRQNTQAQLLATLDLLTQLRERSLILSAASGEVMRFQMLETLREYAMGQLSTLDQQKLSECAAKRFLMLAESAEPKLNGGEQSLWLAKLEDEHDNLRQALTYSLRHCPREALRLAVTLRRFWYVRGHLAEAERWLEQALAADSEGDLSLQARASNAMGIMARDRGDYTQADTMFRTALSLSRRLDDDGGIALALHNLGLIASDQGDQGAARAAYEEAAALWRKLGDRQGQALVLLASGLAAERQGEYAAASSTMQQSVALFRQLDNLWGVASGLQIWGGSLYALGDWEGAEVLLQESLSLHREMEGRRGMALALGTLGDVAMSRNERDTATRYFAESLTLFQEIQDRWGLVLALQRYAHRAYRLGDLLLTARLQGAKDAFAATLHTNAPPGDTFDANIGPIENFDTLPNRDAVLAAYRTGTMLRLDQAITEALQSNPESQ